MNVTLLKMVISTLDSVEVKGKDNLDRLLGCINALESVVQAEEAAQKKPSATRADGTSADACTDNINTQEVDNGGPSSRRTDTCDRNRRN